LALAARASATVSAAADPFATAHEELGRRGTPPLPVSTMNRHRRGDSLNHGSSGPWERSRTTKIGRERVKHETTEK
jgi:hypothetical protein